jgi:hypothetical protein
MSGLRNTAVGSDALTENTAIGTGALAHTGTGNGPLHLCNLPQESQDSSPTSKSAYCAPSSSNPAPGRTCNARRPLWRPGPDMRATSAVWTRYGLPLCRRRGEHSASPSTAGRSHTWVWTVELVAKYLQFCGTRARGNMFTIDGAVLPVEHAPILVTFQHAGAHRGQGPHIVPAPPPAMRGPLRCPLRALGDIAPAAASEPDIQHSASRSRTSS